VKRLPEDFRASHAEVPWREMARMRDILIHAYHRVDVDLVWATVQQSLPTLQDWLEQHLDETATKPSDPG